MSTLNKVGPYQFVPTHSPELLEVALQLYRGREDLQTAFPEMDSPGFLRWLNVDAFMALSAVRKLLPPIPPLGGMDVTSSGGLAGFLEGGFESFRTIQRAATGQGKDLGEFGRALDFGSGFGRTLRFWLPFADEVELHGCDVNPDGVDWCKGALEYAAFETTSTHPPLPYRDEMFDLIWANSIFSHLEENNHKSWLAELQRISSKDALIVVTTHGPESLDSIRHNPAKCRNVGITTRQAAGAKVRLDRDGYAFCRQRAMVNPDLYGMTFISSGYINGVWSEYFEVLEHNPLGLQDWQDSVVLRPKK